jgi:hypothetical protein
MPTISPFTPQQAGTVNLTASTSATLLQLASGGGTQLKINNTASVTVYIEWGASTVVASINVSYPMLTNTGGNRPSDTITIDKGGTVGSVPTSGAIFVSAIASTATTLPIFFTRGEGF